MSDSQTSGLGEHENPSGRAEAPIEALHRLRTAGDGAAGWPANDKIQALLKRVAQRVAHIQARCAAVDVFVAAQLEFASTTDDVEAVYADLQLFTRWHRSAKAGEAEAPSWEDLELRAQVCQRLIESEALLAHQVRQWLLYLQAQKGADSALRLFLTQVAAWHAHVRRQLEQIAADVGSRGLAEAPGDGAEAAGESTRRDLEHWAGQLTDADQLEQLSSWNALADLDRQRLVEFLAELSSSHSPLLESLWQVADLVLIEDRESSPSLFSSLFGDSAGGRRFKALGELLRDESPAVELDELRRHFSRHQAPFEAEHADVVRRALIVAHGDPQVRRRAASAASLDSLWQVVVYPGSPLAAIYAIAAQVGERGDDDLRKVFFDCVKSRLMSSLATLENAGQLELPVRFVSLFFGFGFFIQTRYFEQLETMLQLLRAQAGRFGITMGGLDQDLHHLEIRRHRAGSPEATEPRALDRLPLPVQRHLAREGCYLEFFACHGNHLIAREVTPHVRHDNLGRFLKLSNLNRQLLEEAMRRIDLGGKTDLILEVLTHPKCPLIFAGKHLPQLNRQLLHRIVRGRSTHSEVKRKAMLQMIKQQGGA